MEYVLGGVALAVAAVLVYLLREQRRIGAALLLPKRGVPKDQVADAVARRAIDAALAELAIYEPAHVERQRDRLQQQHRAGDHRKPKRPHGSYDLDQRREHVRIRVAFAYARAKQKPPEQLEVLIRQAIPDDEP